MFSNIMREDQKQKIADSVFLSAIAYKIENWYAEGKNNDEIKKKINRDFTSGELAKPKELTFIDGFMDAVNGLAGCAFKYEQSNKVIVGFSGTNLSSARTAVQNIAADVQLANGVINVASCVEFIEELATNGYDVTRLTGHSLGGYLATRLGLEIGVDLVVTYNTVPLLTSGIGGSTLTESVPKQMLLQGLRKNLRKDKINEDLRLQELYKGYSGKIINFISSNDPFLYTQDYGFEYLGEKYYVYNDRGHAMKYFYEDKSTRLFVNQVLKLEKGVYDGESLEGEGVSSPLRISKQEFLPGNLFCEGEQFGCDIALTDESLNILSRNLESIQVNEIDWIDEALRRCENINEKVRNNYQRRLKEVETEIFKKLRKMGLEEIVTSVNDGYSRLDHARDDLHNLGQLDMDKILPKFNDEMINSENEKIEWYVNDKRWSLVEERLEQTILDMRENIFDLIVVLNATLKTEEVNDHRDQSEDKDIKVDFSSSIAKIANSVEAEAANSLKGTGVRSGNADGVADALEGVLKLESKTLTEINEIIMGLQTFTREFAKDIENLDERSRRIEECLKKVHVSDTYEGYLRENNVFSDVDNVLEAYDKQVEENAHNLSTKLVFKFSKILDNFKFQRVLMFDDVDILKDNLDSLTDILNGLVIKKTIKLDLDEFQSAEKEIFEEQGQLKNFLNPEDLKTLENARIAGNIILEKFNEVLGIIDMFQIRLDNAEERLTSIIRQGIYEVDDLRIIVSLQNTIGSLLYKLIKEFGDLGRQLDRYETEEMIEEFSDIVAILERLLEYFERVVEDSFGE